MSNDLIPHEIIEAKIYIIRGKKVMIDSDLAALYEVETKTLNRAVKRNIDRFPDDFMFKLTKEEFENLRCQIGTSSWGGQRYLPYAFTENGVAMLSGILNSKRAIQVNIQIMRTFTKIREMILTHKELKQNIEKIEQRVEGHEQYFKIVFDALKQLMEPDIKTSKKIGFYIEEKK